MAVRSGAGIGVVVSLVVFILISVFLLIFTIVFYVGQQKALEAEGKAQNALSTYVRPAQRNNETYKAYEDAARSANQSVAEYLHDRHQALMQYVDGAPSTTVEGLKSNFERLGVAGDGVIRHAMQDMASGLRDRENEVERLRTQLQSREDEIAEVTARMDQMRESHREATDQVETQISAYRQSAEDFRRQLDDTVGEMETQVDRMRRQYESRIVELQNEIDQMGEERVVHIDRINELEAKVRQDQITPGNPAALVDGRIIDSAGGNDQVFIDRGRQHHIVRGMTFEVYDDEAALQQVDRFEGTLPRGKASLQVIKVGETTSTCKIVRSVPGRPVVRDDVVANAVYDPNYVFKFLVHGLFDVDGDGRPTAAEAEYLRSLVLDWGGEVVSGETLPGDLDFLVLGQEPPLPAPLAVDAPKHAMDIWVRKRQAYDTYNKLKQQAIDAQIPVLNANRFFILTGYTVR